MQPNTKCQRRLRVTVLARRENGSTVGEEEILLHADGMEGLTYVIPQHVMDIDGEMTDAETEETRRQMEVADGEAKDAATQLLGSLPEGNNNRRAHGIPVAMEAYYHLWRNGFDDQVVAERWGQSMVQQFVLRATHEDEISQASTKSWVLRDEKGRLMENAFLPEVELNLNFARCEQWKMGFTESALRIKAGG